MPNYTLGIDLGTTSIKVSIVDVAKDNILDHTTQETHAEEKVDNPIYHEQNVSKIVSTLNSCLQQLNQSLLQQVNRIGLCCQMHGVMYWTYDDNNKPWRFDGSGYVVEDSKVSRLYTWEDARCDSDLLKTLPTPESHLGVSTGFGIPTTFWFVKNSPKFLKPYNRSGLIGSFIVAMMCDDSQVYTSYQNAASWGFFSCLKSEWNFDVLKKANFPVEILPKLVPSSKLVGKLKNDWHGLPKDTPVGVDMGDLQCSTISTIDTIQDAVLNFSTSAQLAFTVEGYTPPAGPPGFNPPCYWPYFGNQYVAVAASLNGGNTLVTFINMLIEWSNVLGNCLSKPRIWETLLDYGSRDCAASDLKILPTCFGERHSPELTASITNITGANLGLGQVFRALCIGLIQNIFRLLPAETLKSANITRIVGNGKGFFKNKILRAEVERLYKLPLVFIHEGDASKGAAIAIFRYGE